MLITDLLKHLATSLLFCRCILNAHYLHEVKTSSTIQNNVWMGLLCLLEHCLKGSHADGVEGICNSTAPAEIIYSTPEALHDRPHS